MSGFDSKRQASKSLAANPWREAIDAQLVCLHLGTADSFNDANEALAALINWHVSVALDPEVSSDAQALIDRGRAVAEPLTDEQINAIWNKGDSPEHRSTLSPWGMDRIRAIISAAHGIKGRKT